MNTKNVLNMKRGILLFLFLGIALFIVGCVAPAGYCGDGICDFGEQYTCAQDCIPRPPPVPQPLPVCGDGFCDASLGEDQYNCPADCSVQPIPQPVPTPQPTALPSAGNATLHYFEPSSNTDFRIKQNDYFIVNSADFTRVLQYIDIDLMNQELTFSDPAIGILQVVFTQSNNSSVMGEASLFVAGGAHDIYVGSNGDISIDLNGDGSIDGAELQVTTEYDAKIDLGDTNDLSGKDSFILSISTDASKIESPGSGERFDVEIEKRPSDTLGIKSVFPTPWILKLDPEISQYRDTYGSLLEFFRPNIPLPSEEVGIDYPENQRFAEVILFDDSSLVKIEESNNHLEIGEYLGQVRESFTEYDLTALKSGTFFSNTGVTKYDQYLTFPKDNGQIIFGEEDTYGNVGDFLYYRNSEEIFTYRLDFPQGIESSIANNKLVDFLNRDLNIGKYSYTILDADILANNLKLTLLSGEVLGELTEGSKASYTIGGKVYDVEVPIIDSTQLFGDYALITVNGQQMPKMKKGDLEPTNTGMLIGIKDVFFSQNPAVPSRVSFYLDAKKIQWKDSDVTDKLFEKNQGTIVNNEGIEDSSLMIDAMTGATVKILSITYVLNADALGSVDLYVSPGHKLKEYLDEPEGMFLGFDMGYGGLSRGVSYSATSQGLIAQLTPSQPSQNVKSTIIKLYPPARDKYYLSFVNKEGLKYDLPLVSNRYGVFKYGE